MPPPARKKPPLPLIVPVKVPLAPPVVSVADPSYRQGLAVLCNLAPMWQVET